MTLYFSQLIIDPIRFRLDLRREQFLIRISSPNDLDRVWGTPLMEEILADLEFAGLVSAAA